MRAFDESVKALAADGTWNLPFPGSGWTAERYRALAQIGRADLAVARMAEAHTDAAVILGEAGRSPRHNALYGVWASDGPGSQLRAERIGDLGWRLHGVKQYCSGAPFVTAALVTAHDNESLLLFDVLVDHEQIRPEKSAWASAALSDTATGPVSFDAVIGADSSVGPPEWYLKRPGFWHGAVGPAACWAGGALSLVDAVRALNRRDPHSRAQLGALEAAAWGMNALLDQCGREIDDDPLDRNGRARVRALIVRHLIERTCTEALDRFGRATGPQLLAHDAQIARQYAALALYIRQCHAERDLETIPA